MQAQLKQNASCLIICPIGIGNLLMLLPAIDLLKKERPDLQLTLLALKSGITVLAEKTNYFSNIINVNTVNSSLLEKINLISTLRNSKFDASLSFFPSNRREYNLLPFLAGIKLRIAYNYNLYKYKSLSFLNSNLINVDKNKHDLEQNFSILKALSIPFSKKFKMIPFPLTEFELNKGKELAIKENPKNLPIIGIHPGSSAENGMDKKRWSLDSFATLIKKINKNKNFMIFIFGGPEENKLKEKLEKSIGKNCKAIYTMNLFDTASIIKNCKYFLSNDSGLMHIASSLDVSTVGIFGPTSDIRTLPYGPKNTVIRQDKDCAPCWTIDNVGGREGCIYNTYDCLKQLSPDTVFKQLEDFIL